MHRKPLLSLLNQYGTRYPEEADTVSAFINFVSSNANCFNRSLRIGHVTGSAWIVDRDGKNCLLIHHRKLDRWLQPGGHADGCSDIPLVARKEAEEETGLTSLKMASNAIFDIDIHTIPARKNEAEHLHYDVRFLFTANRSETVTESPEIKGFSWKALSEAAKLVDSNDSIIRMIRKTNSVI